MTRRSAIVGIMNTLLNTMVNLRVKSKIAGMPLCGEGTSCCRDAEPGSGDRGSFLLGGLDHVLDGSLDLSIGAVRASAPGRHGADALDRVLRELLDAFFLVELDP